MGSDNNTRIDLHEQIDHRLNLVEDSNSKLDIKSLKHQNQIKALNTRLIDDINTLRKDIQNATRNVDLEIKRIYELGTKLKEKVRQTDMAKMKNTIDTWALESFMHKAELDRRFEFYKYR